MMSRTMTFPLKNQAIEPPFGLPSGHHGLLENTPCS